MDKYAYGQPLREQRMQVFVVWPPLLATPWVLIHLSCPDPPSHQCPRNNQLSQRSAHWRCQKHLTYHPPHENTDPPRSERRTLQSGPRQNHAGTLITPMNMDLDANIIALSSPPCVRGDVSTDLARLSISYSFGFYKVTNSIDEGFVIDFARLRQYRFF
jgi:hypothetical protein